MLEKLRCCEVEACQIPCTFPVYVDEGFFVLDVLFYIDKETRIMGEDRAWWLVRKAVMWP
jgi:hypothetical protein